MTDEDLLRWLAGDIAQVFALESAAAEGVPPDALVATLRFRSGAVGSLECSWGLREGSGLEFGATLTVAG